MQLNFNTELLKKRLKENIERNLVSGHQIHDTYFSNIEKLIELHNISDVHYFSHRGFVGKIIIAFKKVVRKLIRPILNKQILFNQLIIENVRFIQQQVKDSQVEQIKKVENFLMSSIDEIVDEISSQESARDDYIKEVTAENSKSLISQIEQLSIQIEQIKEDSIKGDPIKEASTSILIELGEFYFRKNQYDLSYQLLLSALKYDPANIELENKVLSLFNILNKSRNSQ